MDQLFPAIPYGPERKPWRDTLSSLASPAGGEKPCVSAPSSDPTLHEGVPAGITPALYQVPSSGLTSKEHDQGLEETFGVIEKHKELHLGFSSNHSFDLPSSFRAPFISLTMNNGGDPFLAGSGLGFRPKWIERCVLDYYASLWNAKWPHDPPDPDSYWGYVLTMGSSEGNTHALWSARNYLSGSYLEKKDEISSPFEVLSKEPVVFFSQSSNSSLPKLCNLVNIATFNEVGSKKYPHDNPLGGKWVLGVPCEGGDAGPGTVDVCALEKLVDFFSSRKHPIVVVFNYGATVKCACDEVKCAGDRLVAILKKNNMYERLQISSSDPSECEVKRGFWFHVDGAFSAAYMPFLEMAYRNGLTNTKPASVFDFRLHYISSIVVSGHKYIGIPWPCGIYLVRNVGLVTVWNYLYNESYDTTVALSRNAHSALLLWSFIAKNSYDVQVSSILECVRVVEYAVERFRKLQQTLNKDLFNMHSSPSLSIVFRRPNDDIVEKYTLSCSSLFIDCKEKVIAQIYVVPHVTIAKVDMLISDLETPGAFL